MPSRNLTALCIFSKPGARIRFILILVALVLASNVQSFVPFWKIRPLDEFRNPAPPPRIFHTILHGDGRLSGQINAWFDDRMGFRAVLTRLANQIDYSVFLYSKKVLIGQDGWFFDPGAFTSSIRMLRRGDNLKYERALFAGIAAYLAQKQIRLVIISTPQKETMYSGMLPARRPSLPNGTEFSRFREFLKAGDGRDWLYVDSLDVLKRNATPGSPRPYFHTDPHLTAFGNLLVAREMVNRIAAAERLDWRWCPEFIPVPENVPNGAHLRYLSVFSDVSETEVFPAHRTQYDVKNPPPGETFEKKPANPFEIVFHSDAERAILPRMMLFGNSFVDWYTVLGVYPYFKDVYRMRGEPERISLALQSIPPGTRYFVLQFWETQFADMTSARVPEK